MTTETYFSIWKTEYFKVYETENNQVVSSEVISSNGEGHGALAGVLAAQSVNVLICGGLGGGAQTALARLESRYFPAPREAAMKLWRLI